MIKCKIHWLFFNRVLFSVQLNWLDCSSLKLLGQQPQKKNVKAHNNVRWISSTHADGTNKRTHLEMKTFGLKSKLTWWKIAKTDRSALCLHLHRRYENRHVPNWGTGKWPKQQEHVPPTNRAGRWRRLHLLGAGRWTHLSPNNPALCHSSDFRRCVFGFLWTQSAHTRSLSL